MQQSWVQQHSLFKFMHDKFDEQKSKKQKTENKKKHPKFDNLRKNRRFQDEEDEYQRKESLKSSDSNKKYKNGNDKNTMVENEDYLRKRNNFRQFNF
jgi:hypothetical protein